MAEPLVTVYYSEEAKLWVRQLHFQAAGDKHAGHLHSHMHTTLLAHGTIRVTCEGRTVVKTAPAIIEIAPKKVHDLVADTDGAIAYCVACTDNVVEAP